MKGGENKFVVSFLIFSKLYSYTNDDKKCVPIRGQKSSLGCMTMM